MDWDRAISINHAALARIVATLVALLSSQSGAVRLPLPVYQLIARVLHPAESAVRRLIVIAARGLVVPVPVVRPMPPGLVIVGHPRGLGRMAFQLFDRRKVFGVGEAQAISGPRIRSVGEPDPRSVFLSRFAGPRMRDGLASAHETTRMRQRLAALKQAVDHLPRQAKRMARWLKRRAAMQCPKFTSPLRPGRPPGLRKRSRDEVDEVLRECHALAWDALAHDTS